MRRSSVLGEGTAVGLAFGGAVSRFVEDHSHRVDYLEVPFELLRHDPSALDSCGSLPLVLHCASLSVAGAMPCRADTLSELQYWIRRLDTPWVGEHLAFVSARSFQDDDPETDPLLQIGYTTSAPMNEATFRRVLRNLERYRQVIPVPLLLENSPLYFEVPTSTMSQSDFLRRLNDSCSLDLLLDLTHLYITSRNLGLDPFEELDRLPLGCVVEVHLSGVNEQPNGCWDDHAKAAPAIVHEMLEHVLARVRPRAVTLEYNWSSEFPERALIDELDRVRAAVASAADARP